MTIGTDSVIVAFVFHWLSFEPDRLDAPASIPLQSLPGSAAHPSAPAKAAGGTSERFAPRC